MDQVFTEILALAILSVSLWVLKKQHELSLQMERISERLSNCPSRLEMTNEIAKARCTIKEEMRRLSQDE